MDDLITAQEMVSTYVEAEKAAVKNKSYSINGRTFTRQDLGEIRKGLNYWRREVSRLKAHTYGGSSTHSLASFD